MCAPFFDRPGYPAARCTFRPAFTGYSLSEEDALLRFLIRQFAEDLRDVHGKSIFYVDYTDADVLEERLQGCFRYMNRMDVNNVFTFSGGFVEWIDQILRRT